MPPQHRPTAQGLYDPRFEHDSCGVGLICQIHNQASHQIVTDGLAILRRLQHRGAYGCDAVTGDGAGILLQMPHGFLLKAAREIGLDLPASGRYGCGSLFLPKAEDQRRALMAMCEQVVAEEGAGFLGWRPVPVHSDALGGIARSVEPAIVQMFIADAAESQDPERFERQLYVIRKVMEGRAREMADDAIFHIPSLSSRTLVYKGMFQADQLGPYYPDLSDPKMTSAVAMVHQRYSTNTFPSWDLAHPFRYLCHNGEINTIRGNANWMRARESSFQSDRFGPDMAKLFPIARDGDSDSAILDSALELLIHTGRSPAHAMMMLIPEAWRGHATMDPARRDFYQYHDSLMEPWDGPAAIIFTDGRQVGATLDRNGLRPARYTVTTDHRLILASEAGVIPVAADQVASKGRLHPGRMLLVDLDQGRIVPDGEIKAELSQCRPYGEWVKNHRLSLADLPMSKPDTPLASTDIHRLQQAVGMTDEEVRLVLTPMAAGGAEAIGSMGDDTPPAVFSAQNRSLFDYFKQLFAQVTNPPLDAIREAIVTSIEGRIGAEGNLFEETPEHCRQLTLPQPILLDEELAAIRNLDRPGFKVATLPMLFAADGAPGALADAMTRLCREAEAAVRDDATILILSDRDRSEKEAGIPSLLAVAGVHHHLIREGLRIQCGIVVESAEPREVHHFCCLIGYGAAAINPYLALALAGRLADDGRLGGTVDPASACQLFQKASGKGILKVMSKMGISTLRSYRGAQIFEAVGLDRSMVDAHFAGTVSRIGGSSLERIADAYLDHHRRAFAPPPPVGTAAMAPGGKYQWRRDGETHQYTPETIARFHQAVRTGDRRAWIDFRDRVNQTNQEGALIRGLLGLKPAGEPVPLAAVEPWESIVSRFKTGAMSYGSISQEAHEALAIAMNRIGAKSNSGEGGEDADRFTPDSDGTWRNSAIKQVASGRFGVTIDYLASAREIQIKMAQGAKPGEGGQLPGFKVYPWIAKTRRSTPYVGLISPPPHHDIYSIEDLAQLIHDLRTANPAARISVKLVSESGVGTVAAGVVKALADVVLISGESGGTGAAPLTSVKYGGLPWELGLSETHQTLLMNGLRDKIVVECDGQLKTGRDVVVASLLGADEFGFGTIGLMALGCIMMRVCHLNTCPVGIATQDPVLRKKFIGHPDHVVHLMRFIAEDVREIMAELGFTALSEMTGRTDCLDAASVVDRWQQWGVDLAPLVHQPEPPPAIAEYCRLSLLPEAPPSDADLINRTAHALDRGEPISIDLAIDNTQRTRGTRLSGEVIARNGPSGLPPDTIRLKCEGSAGQSFMAFGAPGITAVIHGEANDYFGKGLSGARLAIRPPDGSTFDPESAIIVGNVALYGATGGAAFICGVAGERFCVRNSGADAVVEGVGDHGCEYMTGGCAVILGPTGRNFAAGMSGGIAFVYDPDGAFSAHGCNMEMVGLEPVVESEDRSRLKALVADHEALTQSPLARQLLADWDATLESFVKVIPHDYKAALARLAEEADQGTSNG